MFFSVFILKYLKITTRQEARSEIHPGLISRKAAISGRNIACYFLRCTASTIIDHLTGKKMNIRDRRNYRRCGKNRFMSRIRKK